ncbi:MAG: EAL domain-containing protein [Pseudomonadota bacterium]
MNDKQSDILFSDDPIVRDNRWLPLTLFGVATFLMIVASFKLGFADESVVTIWPAAGISVWITLRYGNRALPTVFLSQLSYSLIFQDLPWTMMLGGNGANTIACYVAVTLYKRQGGGTNALLTLRDTLMFISLLAGLMSIIAAAIGSAAVILSFGLPLQSAALITWRWFFSDLTGTLLIAPMLMTLHRNTASSIAANVKSLWQESKTPTLLFIAVQPLLWATVHLLPDDLGQFPVVLLTMPMCIWFAFNHQSRVSVFLMCLTVISSLVVMLSAIQNPSEGTFLAAQLYGVVVVCTSLFLRASNVERASAVEALAYERQQLEQRVAARTSQLKELAETDTLTGLSNRRSFQLALENAHATAARGNHPTFLLFMDLDQFKIVNDTSGHAAGDALLKHVTEIIRENIRDIDTAGRLGGDEFALILQSCPQEKVLEIAESIRHQIDSLRFSWENEVHQIGVSIGAVPLNEDFGSLEDIKQTADAACYAAKNAGRNRVHLASVSDESLREHRGEVRWAQRINEAINKDQFILYGQAIQPANSLSVEPEHIEILLRLRDYETRSFVQPGAFLPAAERYGLATKLDEWVVKNLIKNIYVHSAFDASERQYWVNLSGASVGDEKFVNFLIDEMTNSPIQPGLINFEITETAVIRNISEAQRLMQKLHDMGCKFALDDFGTGLSSFSHLKKLPVDHLKIDGHFIREIHKAESDRIFVKSIIDIAHAMNLKAVAEYVENDEILRVVTELGVDYIQGFGIHRPEPFMPSFNTPSLPMMPDVSKFAAEQ